MMMKKILVIVLFPLQAFQLGFSWPDEPSEGFFQGGHFGNCYPSPEIFFRALGSRILILPGEGNSSIPCDSHFLVMRIVLSTVVSERLARTDRVTFRGGSV